MSTVDSLQQQLTDQAFAFDASRLSEEAMLQVKLRIVDTLGALIAGQTGEAAHTARELVLQMSGPGGPGAGGATIMGTQFKASPEMAAFVNAITARSAEMMDVYHYPGAFGGHPSDVVMPTFAAAEHVHASGRELITAVALAYEVFLSFSNVFRNNGFDDTNFGCIATAISASKLWRLSREQMSHAIAMAVVPNVALKQVRTDELTAWKVVATGHAGRAGLFAAMLAKQGLEGPSLPFEGKAGWLDHVARERLVLPTLGGGAVPLKILDTRIKMRPCAGETISSVLAAEMLHGKLGDLGTVRSVEVELYKRALERAATGEHHWSPKGRDAVANAIPYLIATALREGGIRLDSFDEAHLMNADTRALMQKITFVENPEFTKTYPHDHRTRIVVTLADGRQVTGESGGGDDDLSSPKTQAQIGEKFLSLTGDFLGRERATGLLERLWDLDKMADVADIPRALAA